MNTLTFWFVFSVFITATLALAVYGIHLYVLLILFSRRARNRRAAQQRSVSEYMEAVQEDAWPIVTSQLPIYNESHVAARVIDAVAAFDYPEGRHEIQILDDSTDHTREIIDRAVERWRARGVDVSVIRREHRVDFKAGALDHGLKLARGKYVAIFDADFQPDAGFLRTAIPLLEQDQGIACLQGRWDHLNRQESWLTAAQALGIDGHFAVEQGARAWNGLMMNFNGTAGVWRVEAINARAVGGWSGDTLTEDLDLSYRAQLAGWRLEYCLDLPCPAELPGTVSALKSQQQRWATGSIQVACKLLPSIWRAPLSLGEKLEATLHLTHYSVALWMLILALVARPALLVLADQRLYADWAWAAWTVILVSAFAPSVVYAYARYSLGGGFSGLRVIPSMFILGCGLCVSNGLAVVRGMFRKGGEFVRTPKSGSTMERVKSSSYAATANWLWLVELILAGYSAVSFALCYTHSQRAFSVFLLIYTVGFAVVGWKSRPDRSISDAPDVTLAQAKASTP